MPSPEPGIQPCMVALERGSRPSLQGDVRTIAKIRAPPLGEEVEKLWLHDNAKRFLRL